MRNKSNPQIHIGTFLLGSEFVELFAWVGQTGGEFWLCPDKRYPARIKVGLEYDSWPECVSVLLHEVMEFSLVRHRVRFARCSKYNNDHSDYLFSFDHPQFASVCSDVGGFVTEALPKLATTYRKYRP